MSAKQGVRTKSGSTRPTTRKPPFPDTAIATWPQEPYTKFEETWESADRNLTGPQAVAEEGVVHPKVSAEFVARMEDVLDLYAEPYDPKRPVVCFDETSKQLVAEKRAPIPAKAGRRERFDYEYQRNGTRNLFMTCEPLAGWRHVAVTGRRTMEDFAHQMRWLSDAAYPDAEKVRVVLDNLNTHRPASLYEAFEPKEARRVIQRLEFHYTPKHGSWLNMAEIEFSVLV